MRRPITRVCLAVCLVLVLSVWMAWDSLIVPFVSRVASSAPPSPEQPDVSPTPSAASETPAPKAHAAATVAAPPKSPPPPAEEPPFVTGHVFTEEPLRGAPGVAVDLLERLDDDSVTRLASAVTDDNGRFELGGVVRGGRYGLKPLVTLGYVKPEDEWFTLESTGSGAHAFVWHREGATIAGTLRDVTCDFSHVDFDAIVKILVAEKDSPGAAEKAIAEVLAPRPAQGMVVALPGDSLVLRTVTDPQGKFEFTGLARGDYEVSVDEPPQMLSPGTALMNLVRRKVTVSDGNVKLDLTFRTDLVAVRGRVVDVYGRPVAGAKVTTVYDGPVDEWGQGIESGEVQDSFDRWAALHTRSVLSDAAGRYELEGLESTQDFNDLYYLAGYLHGGNGAQLKRVGIRVEAEGFVQRKEDVPRVLLVTKAQLDAARRFLKALWSSAEAAGHTEPEEKKDLPLPTIEGNTILAPDVVLDLSRGLAQ
jgi:hypothetical protein